MGESTGIAWCDHTFNPWIGCAKVAPECKHCYAETWGNRFGVGWGPREERRLTSLNNWDQPLKWNRAAKRDGVRRRVFCASLADVFEDREELAEWRERLFGYIEDCNSLDWLLLTKRPENMTRMAPESWREGWPAHVRAGTSAGTQATADKAIPHLLTVPARVHFVSCEPLLGPIDFRRVPGFNRIGIDLSRWWVIGGGESGPNARPCDLAWLRSLRDQCKAAGVPYFCKQLGARPYDSQEPLWVDGMVRGTRNAVVPLTDRAGADPSEWPEDLRVQEYPRGP